MQLQGITGKLTSHHKTSFGKSAIFKLREKQCKLKFSAKLILLSNKLCTVCVALIVKDCQKIFWEKHESFIIHIRGCVDEINKA